MQTLFKILLTIVSITIIFIVGMGAGYALNTYLADNQPSEAKADNFSIYWETWNRVEQQFYGEIPSEPATTYGAIKGALATLHDPYTVFIEPEPAAAEKAHLEGQFGGIGAYVRVNEFGQISLDPMRDRPAANAGMQEGDILVAVDGQSILGERPADAEPDSPIPAGMSVDEVVSLIRGEIGTQVILTVERQGEQLDLTVERAIIETPSATWNMLDEDPTIGYIRLSSFTERSNEELNDAFTELSEQGAEKYIFDLRGNGGGLLETAIDVASQFLSEGLVLIEDRKNDGERTYEVRSGGKALSEEVVLLIDGGTASASEIVAGALKDYDRATLIGEKSFGKGSVQLIYELSDASRLHVTVAKWFTPLRNKIDGEGLQPDIEILFTEEDHAEGRDPQLIRAIEFLQNGE
ncbi:S41 family peptidase [Anaerolineales bacterium HSG25]|nr:S41 family peptidase [Anaerolineales bacterium HSG25]